MGHPAQILIVDDCPVQTLLFTLWLEHWGYIVHTVASGEQALALLQAAPPDLIVLDAVLPGLSGLDTYRQIRAVSAWARIPVIMVTGLRPEEQHAARAAGIPHVLPKPPPPEDLQACVAALLQAS